jgi:hypothetical protein
VLSIQTTTYTCGDEVVLTEWASQSDGSVRRLIVCTVCSLHHELVAADTFFGHMGEYKKAEKIAMQWMIDRGCRHISTSASMKALAPDDMASSGKGKGKSSGGAKGKK